MSKNHSEQQHRKFQAAWVFKMSDSGPSTVREVFLERGWMEHTEDMPEEEWNVWWKSSRFRRSEIRNSHAYQKLNHFPGTCEITRKDSLCRQMRRQKMIYGSVYDFIPAAFILPNEYIKFVADYSDNLEKGNSKVYICKPADKARGRGIFIFKCLTELAYDGPCVAQEYITNPFLIGGYKFDLRIYVVVTNFHPLTVYMYREGLARFSTEKYDLTTLGNIYAHLTNTSINKFNTHSGLYKIGPGYKWTLEQWRQFMTNSKIDHGKIWSKIVDIIILTLLAQTDTVPNETRCFELYGFDILLDEHLKPWLLEVNFSPALSSDCVTDENVKKPMLHDLIDLLNFQRSDQIKLVRDSISDEEGDDDSDGVPDSMHVPDISPKSFCTDRNRGYKNDSAVDISCKSTVSSENKTKKCTTEGVEGHIERCAPCKSSYSAAHLCNIHRYTEIQKKGSIGDFEMIYPFSEKALQYACKQPVDIKSIINEMKLRTKKPMKWPKKEAIGKS